MLENRLPDQTSLPHPSAVVPPPAGLPRLGPGQKIALAVLAAAVVAFLAMPWSVLDKLRAAGYGICAQRPAHSYFLGGEQLPIEARMVGIFGGFVMTLVAFALLGRIRSMRMASLPWMLLCVSGIGIMGADGLNAFFYDLRGAGVNYLYVPDIRLRLITGLLSGFGIAGLVLPAINFTLWQNADRRPVLRHVRDLLPVAGLLTVFGLLTASGWGFLLYPIALISITGVVLVLMTVNLLLVLTVLGREGSLRRPSDALGPATAALLLSAVELAGLGLLRLWFQTTFGISTLG